MSLLVPPADIATIDSDGKRTIGSRKFVPAPLAALRFPPRWHRDKDLLVERVGLQSLADPRKGLNSNKGTKSLTGP